MENWLTYFQLKNVHRWVDQCLMVSTVEKSICGWAYSARHGRHSKSLFSQTNYLVCALATELQTCGGRMTLFEAGGRSHLDAT